MTHIFCKRGHVPIAKGQEWALRVKGPNDFVGFLILRVEGFENESVALEVVQAEHQGVECDMVQKIWHDALDQFGYDGKLHFAHAAWHVWHEMMPNRA